MKPRSFRALIALVLLLVAAGAGTYFWARMKTPNPAERYRTATLERGDLTQMASANGTLNPVMLVTVGTQVSGTVKKWYADFNDRVEQGQILLELDPALYQAQARQSEAGLASAQSQLKLAQANDSRTRALFKQEYVTRQDLDISAQAVAAARAAVAAARAQVDHDRINLAYTVIRSPVSGVVVSRQVDVGQTVAASFQTPTLFTIAQDLSKMQIDSSYAEADVGSLKVGQPVIFRVDAYPNRSFKGVVRQVRLNPTTQQNVVTYDVVVAVDNPELILMPGMTAYVDIIVATRQDVLLVPNAALRFRPAETKTRQEAVAGDGAKGAAGTVYVLAGGRPKAVGVRVGITDNRNTEIVAGELKAGDAVIVEDRQPPAKAPSGPGMRLF
ncbi:MAG TPA: efflux RND transporter periplasmic adaptor subunit [Rhodocyclaceae bacterium]|nr:efflux RND transporter periplasmic adaptor subunit [Rhodocyclaceae bacterium]